MNQAFQFLNRGQPPARVVAQMAAVLGTSPRQAARYVRAAQGQSAVQTVPETKEAFTVKLPKSLAKRVRQAALAQNSSISDWVGGALESQLGPPRRHG